MKILKYIKTIFKQNIKYIILTVFIVILILAVFTSDDLGTTITAIFTALSAVFVGIQARDERISNTVFRQRDKNKMAIKVIGAFDNLVLSRMRDINSSHNFEDITKKSYLAMKSFVRIYSFIDSGLANEELIKRYINHDLLFMSKNLKLVADSFLKQKRFRYMTSHYVKIMEKEYGFKKQSLI